MPWSAPLDELRRRYLRQQAELGGEEGYARLGAALRDKGMGQLLDIVPNHMAVVTPHNRWWWDVLENGPSSRYAAYFDVDWDPPEAKLRNTVLLPVLEDQYGRVLEKKLLGVKRTDGTFTIRYHDHEWPVAPRSVDTLLAAAAERAGSDELAFMADAHGRLAASTATDVSGQVWFTVNRLNVYSYPILGQTSCDAIQFLPFGMGIRNMPVAAFAAGVARRLQDRPVVDRTGLDGRYDARVLWRPDEMTSEQLAQMPSDQRPPDMNIFEAFEEQAGLKLEARREPIEVLVVDHIQEADEN